MTTYSVLSALTSSPISLVAATKASEFYYMYLTQMYTVYLKRSLKVNNHKPDVAASVLIYARQIQREGKLT